MVAYFLKVGNILLKDCSKGSKDVCFGHCDIQHSTRHRGLVLRHCLSHDGMDSRFVAAKEQDQLAPWMFKSTV